MKTIRFNTARLLAAMSLLALSPFIQAQELTVGSGSGAPGDSVDISIDFANNGSAQVVAMNFDILFDPVEISAVDLSSCDGVLLSPGEVACSTPAPGVVRIIAYTLDLLPVESTQLGSISFTVDANTGASTIFLDIDDAPATFVMSDEFANSVSPASLLGGEISVGGSGFLEATPSPVNFGPVDIIDPLVCQSVTAVNSGTANLVIEDNVLSGGLPFSIQNDTCLGNQLIPSGSCTIDVCFDPADPGNYSDTLTILGDTNNVDIDLFGEGVGGIDDSNLAVTPTSVDFLPIEVGSPGACSVLTAENTGLKSTLLVGTVGLLDGAPFSVATTTCPGADLLPGETCSITVCFNPEQEGSFIDDLIVTSSANDVFVPVTGDGLAPVDDSNLVVTPVAVEFDPIEVGAPGACAVLEARNSGQQSTLLVESADLVSGPPFSRVATSCPGAELLPGQICSITICFNPEEEGTFIDDLVVVSSANDVTVPISGQGFVPPPTGLMIAPPFFAFGQNEPAQLPVCTDFTVTNQNIELDIEVTDVSFESGEDFALGDSNCPDALLAPGASCSVTVCFDRDDVGVASDLLIVSGNDLEPVSAQAALSGELQIPPELSVIPDSVEFGLNFQGFSNPSETIDVRNTGQAGAPDLIFDRFELSEEAPFELVTGTCESGTTLVAGGDGCTVTVMFSTADTGTFDAELLALTLEGESASVALSGEVQIAPELSVIPDSVDFGLNFQGFSNPSVPIKVRNTSEEGAPDLILDRVELSGEGPFELLTGTCESGTTLVAGGDGCTVTVVFSTAETGTFEAELLALTLEGVDASAALSGEIQIAPELSVTPDSVDFGLFLQGFSSPLAMVAIQNSSPAGAPDLIIDRVELSEEGPFQLLTGTCVSGTTLVAGDEGCAVAVRLSTAEIGAFEASLQVLTLEEVSESAELRGEIQALDEAVLADRIVFRGPGVLDNVGWSLDAVRGFSSSGLTELMMGAPGDDSVYLVSDILLGLGAFADDPALLSDIAMADGSAGVRLDGETGPGSACDSPGFGFGFSVAAVSGGTNPTAIPADGDPIIAIGDPNWGGPGESDEFDSRGAAYLLKGSRAVDQGALGVETWLAADDESPSAGLRLVRRASEGPCIGSGLAGLGDIDGDGYPDMVVQDSPISIAGDVGVQHSYIVYGSSDLFELDELDVGNSPERVTRLAVPFNEGLFFVNQATVSAAGDFNGDGAGDFVVTAPNARFFNMSEETLHAGAAFVMLGSADRLPAELTIPQMIDATTFGDDVRIIYGPQVTAHGGDTLIGIDTPRFGASVDAAGDINGDGLDDLVIGAGEAENAPGVVFVIYGSDDSTPILVDEIDATTGQMVMSVASDDVFFGEAVRGIGDVTGDRINDILIGAPYSDAEGSDGVTAEGAGRVYVASGASLSPLPGEAAAVDLRRVDLDGALPASALEAVRFGSALAGFGTDVTSDFGNDFAASAFRGAATDGGNGGGWVFVESGDAPPPPTIDAVDPTVGPESGGTLISIAGADFAEGASVDLVSGDQSIPCSQVEWVSASLLTCITPLAEPGEVDVQVTNPEGQKDVLDDAFTFIEVTSLSIVVDESPDDFGLDGRLIQIDITNPGAVDATALNLSVALSAPGQSIDTALNLLVDCGVTDDGVRCSSSADPRWSCSIEGSMAQCSQSALRSMTTSRLLLLVSGDGPIPVTVSVDAFNAAPADGEAELFQ